jgi:hypothetical protein
MPDGTPMDPRVKVAQFQANMNGYMARLSQLTDLESTYKAELKALTDAEAERQNAITEKNKTALMYLKDLQQQDQQKLDNQYRTDQSKKQSEQFNATLNQPELKLDEN